METIEQGRVGIVIVNYNGAQFQNDSIKSIKEQSYDNFIIIVVDSGSTDNSISMLRKEYDDVVILEQEENIGVAAGNNIGIKYALENFCEYVLLLNNDVELEPRMIETLMAVADESTVVVPKIYYYDNPNIIWMAGGEMNWRKGETRHFGIDKMDDGNYNKKKKISYAPTCAMLVHRKVFETIGFVDEEVFMYFDDTDLCVRILDAGFQLLYVPEAKMWHKVSSSSGGKTSKFFVYYYYRNQQYFLSKYKSKCGKYAVIYSRVKAWLKCVLAPVKNKNDKYIAVALRDYKTGTMGRKEWK